MSLAMVKKVQELGSRFHLQLKAEEKSVSQKTNKHKTANHTSYRRLISCCYDTVPWEETRIVSQIKKKN